MDRPLRSSLGLSTQGTPGSNQISGRFGRKYLLGLLIKHLKAPVFLKCFSYITLGEFCQNNYYNLRFV